jgi:hypothetical protein
MESITDTNVVVTTTPVNVPNSIVIEYSGNA